MLGAALALYGEAWIGQCVAHGRAVFQGNQEEEDIIFVEDVLAEYIDTVAAGAKVE